MKRNRSGSSHRNHKEDESSNDVVQKDKGEEMGDSQLLVVTRANLSKMDGLLRSTLTFVEGEEGSSNKQTKVFMRHFRKRITECCQDLCLLEDHFNEENVALSCEWSDLCNRLRAVKGRLRVKRARIPYMAELLSEKQLQRLAEDKKFEELLVDSKTHNAPSENLKKLRAKLNVTVDCACTQMEKMKGPLQECAWNIHLKADSLRSTMLSVKNLLEVNKRGTEAAMRQPPPKRSGGVRSQQAAATHSRYYSAAETREKERELKSAYLRMKKSAETDAKLARLLNHLPL